MSNALFSIAFGVGTQNRQGNWLEIFYAQPLLSPAAELVAKVTEALDYSGGNQAIAISNNQAAKLAEAEEAANAAAEAPAEEASAEEVAAEAPAAEAPAEEAAAEETPAENAGEEQAEG